MRADVATERTLGDLLERFCFLFRAREREGVLALFAPDDDVMVVTSEESVLRGPDELRAFLDAYVSGATTYSWTWDRRQVSAAGSTAWLLAEGTETATTQDGEEKHAYRMTMVCEQRGGRWLLMQIHGSSPHSG